MGVARMLVALVAVAVLIALALLTWIALRVDGIAQRYKRPSVPPAKSTFKALAEVSAIRTEPSILTALRERSLPPRDSKKPSRIVDEEEVNPRISPLPPKR